VVFPGHMRRREFIMLLGGAGGYASPLVARELDHPIVSKRWAFVIELIRCKRGSERSSRLS
jgi:hypothetical protein